MDRRLFEMAAVILGDHMFSSLDRVGTSEPPILADLLF